MDDLHLTDEQINELSGMGVAGAAVANGLELWRELDPVPWGRKRQESIAVNYARNSAELVAAAVYWTLSIAATFVFGEPSPIYEGSQNEVNAKLAAIGKALKELT